MLPLVAFMVDFAAFFGIRNVVLCSLPLQSDDAFENSFEFIGNTSKSGLNVAFDPCETVGHFAPKTLVWSTNMSLQWTTQNRHLVFLTDEDLSEKSKVMPLRLDSHVYSYKTYSDKNISITEWYMVEGRMFVNELAIWSLERRLKGADQNIWSQSRRGNLQGIVLKDAVIPCCTDVRFDANGKLTGTIIEAVSLMEAALNFTTVRTFREDGEWGFFRNGTWDGLYGDLAYNRVSFASTALWYFEDVAMIVDFGLGLYDASMTVGLSPYYGQSSKTKLNAKAFMTVFNWQVWILLGLIGITTGTVYTILSKTKTRGTRGTYLWSFFEGLIEYFATLMQRTLAILNHNPIWLQRIILGLQLCSMFVFFAYTSGLTAFVTVKETIVKPNNFQDMLDMGIRLVWSADTGYMPLVGGAKSGTPAGQMLENILFVPSDANTELRRVVNDAPDERAIIINSDDRSGFEALLSFEERTPHAESLSFPKDSELKPMFDYQVIKMHNLGLLDKILFDQLDDSKPEDKTNDLFYDDVPSVTIEGLYFPISLIASGILLSGFIAAFEKCFISTGGLSKMVKMLK